MKFFGSGLFDWLVFAIVFIFTLVGFAIFLTTGDITLVATSVFFGACSVVAGQSLWQNFRSSRLAGELTVDVIGGVPIVSQQSKQQTIYGVVLLLMGAIMALAGTSLGWVFVGCSVFIGITGALLLIARVAGGCQLPVSNFIQTVYGLTLANSQSGLPGIIFNLRYSQTLRGIRLFLSAFAI